MTKKSVERDRLIQSEIDAIRNKEISINRLAVVRDLFVFQCYTGLAYKDLFDLNEDQIQLGVDGNQWIFGNRQKTKVSFRVPLLDVAKKIIDKYKNHVCRSKGKLLPVPSNQKLNAYLKEIQDLCSIKKKLCTHTARHSFATTIALSNGVTLESLSKMLGHSSTKHTELYGKVMDTKISGEMEALRRKAM